MISFPYHLHFYSCLLGGFAVARGLNARQNQAIITIYFINLSGMRGNNAYTQEYFNAETYDMRDTQRSDEIKNQYSTFIEQLEETTEKLMNEVFNTEYQPQIQDEESLINEHQQRLKRLSGPRLEDNIMMGVQNFSRFLTRNNKWQEMKEMHISREVRKKQEQERKLMRDVPQILRGSLQKLDPIYDRALELHSSKQKKRAFKRIENKKSEQEKFKQYTFHPEINSASKPRSLQDYLKDKSEWDRKKKQSRQLKKLQRQASKYNECSFTPQLVSKPLWEKSSRIKQGQCVEDRLLRSLEKVATGGK